jgi:hypothetical protein
MQVLLMLANNIMGLAYVLSWAWPPKATASKDEPLTMDFPVTMVRSTFCELFA